MKPWKRIEPTILTKIDYHTVIVKTFEMPNGKIATRASFSGEDSFAAAVIALTKDNRVIVARQFRPGPEMVLDEIPGGGVDKGEDPEAAAKRELLEETGYTPGSMVYLGEFVRDAYNTGRWFYYLAIDCEKVTNQTLDDEEFVEVRTCSISEFLANAMAGKMTDPAAVLAAYEHLKQLEEK